jgi:ankyrin repeat protein
LLEHGADWSATHHPGKFSALEYAITNENDAIVHSLLAAGASLDFRRISFNREGAEAARQIVRLLLQYGFDINQRDDWGRTPLMWAAERAPVETVRFLIESGANVNMVSGKNMNGVSGNETALRLARRAKRDDVVRLLRSHGAR